MWLAFADFLLRAVRVHNSEQLKQYAAIHERSVDLIDAFFTFFDLQK